MKADDEQLAGTPQTQRDGSPPDGRGTENTVREGRLALPKPVVRERHWTRFLFWLVPLAALLLTAFYAKKFLAEKGPTITITVPDATMIDAGETPVRSKGVQIGVVRAITLTPDLAGANVEVELNRPAEMFARDGAQFWLVKPDFSGGSISGLGTVLSGPYFEASAGNGDAKTDFVVLPEAPNAPIDGLPIRLITPRVKGVERGTPINFRGCVVGVVDTARLAEDGTHVIVRAVIQSRYAPLVRVDSQFWTETPADVKGGIFSGLQVKLGSIRQILSGGITFASPGIDREPTGKAAGNDETFLLHDEADKEASKWTPVIPIVPVDPAPLTKKSMIGVK